jgi:hypothetical protein
LKTIAEQSGRKRDFFYLSILLTIALGVGLYLIITTAVIAKDAVTFIRYAQEFDKAPAMTMADEFQHPGYPWLILAAHKITAVFYPDSSVMRWVYCGQGVALLFRLLTIIAVYFLGKRLFDARLSFFAALILVFLPEPAKYGSDALSDWPHLFFLVAGFLFLVIGAVNNNRWLFGLAGLSAGAGYLVRPECAQIIVLGSFWCGLQIVRSKSAITRSRAISSFMLLLAAFMIFAAPYMKLKGAVFPKKDVGRFSAESKQEIVSPVATPTVPSAAEASRYTPTRIAGAVGKFAQQTSQTLMWFFVLPLLIGIYNWFKKRKWYDAEKFFIIILIAVNLSVLVWLYCRHGYMSDRHTLPLMTVLVLFIPAGLQELALWLEKKVSGEVRSDSGSGRRFYFVVLLAAGIFICVPKLLKPIRIEERGYKMAADWLAANTKSSDVVAVPDKRINFYAGRMGPVYEDENIPAGPAYVVKKINTGNSADASAEKSGRAEYRYIDKKKKRVSIAIYKNL